MHGLLQPLIVTIFLAFMSMTTTASPEVKASDRLDVIEQVYRYAYRYDANDMDGLQALFTEQATSRLVRGGQVQSGRVKEFVAFTRARMQEKQTDGVIRRHIFSNLIVHKLEDDFAEVSAMVLIMNVKDNQLSPFLTAPYRFTLERRAGRWLISHLSIESDITF